MRIGIDLDNTIIGYDESFRIIAAENGWLSSSAGSSKKNIRDAVRLLPDGEGKWMQMQALAYGQRIDRACVIEGAAEFVQRRLKQGDELFIVSHKTRYAAADPNGCDLRQAAMNFLMSADFFCPIGHGLQPHNVFFADTRAQKCQYITELQCDVFIDDLEEVFTDPHFPVSCRRILFHPGANLPNGNFQAFLSWKDIIDAQFHS